MPGLQRAARSVAGTVLACVFLAVTAPCGQAQSDLSRSQILELQDTLNALDYDAGPEDGLYGDRTAAAIRAFERAHGMTVTGEADMQLLERARREARATRAEPETQADPPASSAPADVSRSPGAPPGDGASSPPKPDDAAGPTARDRVPAARSGAPGGRDPEADRNARADRNAGRDAGAGATGERPTAQPTAALTGTRWRVRDESGATFTVTFEPDGQLEGPTVSGDWRWRRRSDRLVIEFDAGPGMTTRRTAPWPGNGDTMDGTAESSTGRTWSWTARKVATADPQA